MLSPCTDHLLCRRLPTKRHDRFKLDHDCAKAFLVESAYPAADNVNMVALFLFFLRMQSTDMHIVRLKLLVELV